MDTATQALLGAVVGQAGFSGRLGRRALGWGAVGGLVPDLDVLAVATHGPWAELWLHRGFTHALWFGPVVGPILGYAVWRLHARRRAGPGEPGAREALPAWMGLFTLALLTHPLLDLFTTYGTQLLAPFSSARFALNGVAIIDPFYSVVLLAALGVGLVFGVTTSRARRAGMASLAISTAYLLYGWHLNEEARRNVEDLLARQGATESEVRVYPTILQPWLRRVVARTPDAVHVGLHTRFRPDHVAWDSFPPAPPHPLVDKLRATPEGSLFVWFAMGEIHTRVVEGANATLVEIDDLRYGLPDAPDRGLWGIRAIYDRSGRLRGPVERYRRNRTDRGSLTLRSLWRATVYGDGVD